MSLRRGAVAAHLLRGDGGVQGADAVLGDASAISTRVSPVAGSMTGKVPAEPSTHSPPMNSPRGTFSSRALR
jgi:hypothetical protein